MTPLKFKLALFMSILFLGLPSSGLADASGEIVARLDGKVFPRSALPSQSRQEGGLSPSESVESDAVALVAWVLEIRKSEAMERLGLAITDEEVSEAVQGAIGNGTDYLRRNNELLRRLPRALRMVRGAPERADEIYAEELQDFMPHALWLKHVERNYSDEDIAALENHAPMDGGELEKVAASVRSLLAERKLRGAVAGTGGPLADREQRWQAWCRKQVREADVTIEEGMLRDGYERIVERLCPVSSEIGEKHPHPIGANRALNIAFEAVGNAVDAEKNSGIVCQEGDKYVVTFPAPPPSSMPKESRLRGPDYAARVVVDADSGDVLEVKVAP